MSPDVQAAIDKLVASAPPLTPEQKSILAMCFMYVPVSEFAAMVEAAA